MNANRTSGVVLVAAVAALTLFPASRCPAAPAISSVSGTFAQGQQVVVSGADFGSTGQEVPIKFDDFESGVVGASLGTGGWSVTADNGPDVPEYSSARSWSGSKSGYCDIWSGGDSAAYKSGLNSETFYVSLMYYGRIDAGCTNQKGVRVHANDGPNIYTSYPAVFCQCPITANRHTVAPYDESGSIGDYSPTNLSQNTWYRLEYWFKMSTPAGATNGEVLAWQNLTQQSYKPAITELTRASGVTDKWRLVMLPFYMGNGGGGEHWYDDAYISRSKARVEIGNASTWSGCTIRQIQGVTSWSGSSISMKANLGSFGYVSDKYLYVVDANGVVNQQGYYLGGHILTVTNGSGSGEYDEGEVVAISANPAPSGKAFAAWAGDFAYVADRLQADTTVTMPAADVSVTAVYAFIYTLKVNSGTGDGQYFPGTVVEIEADPVPTDKEFAQWTGQTANVADTASASTTVTMPSTDVEITATYTDIPPLYWPGDVNHDFFVGGTDLDIILGQWGRSGMEITDLRADINNDNFVGGTDLDYVLADWGKTGSPP